MIQEPLRPPLRTLPGARIPGRAKVAPEDFVVEEVPAYEPKGSGTHVFLWIEKRGLSTHDAVKRLAVALGKPERDFGFAGLKDALAISRQWLSIEHCDQKRAAALAWDDLRVLDVRLHDNKLRAGHLHGNRFAIVLRDVGQDHLAALRENIAFFARHGALNWFGEQRFGKRGANLQKGLDVLRANDPRQALRRIPRYLQKLVLSAVQSEAFNRVLARRLETTGTLMDGDIAFLHQKGAAFLVKGAKVEQPRCDSFEISPSGPLPGPRCLQPEGEPGRIEAQALEELEITHERFAALPRDSHPGARRPLRVPIGVPRVEAVAGGIEIGFELPAGSYATAVLREVLTQSPWFGPTKESEDPVTS